MTISASGTYAVTLSDLGAALPQSLGGPAALADVALAITDSSGSLVAGATLTAPGTATFIATAGTYDIHVTGKPGPNSTGTGVNPASGPVSIVVTANAGQTQVASFTGALALPPNAAVPSDDAVLSDTFTVSAPCTSCEITLTDLQMPSALSNAFVAILAQGSGGEGIVGAVALSTSNPPPSGNNSVTSTTFGLTPGVTYQIFAVGEAGSGASAGLYSVIVSPSGGGAPVYGAKVVPVGLVTQLGPAVNLNTGLYTLTLTDLDVPNALQQASVVVVADGLGYAPAIAVPTSGSSGSSSCSGSGSSTSPLTNCASLNVSTPGTYEVFASGTPSGGTAGGAAGSYAVTLQSQSGGAPALAVARAVVAPGATQSAYSYDTTLTAGGSYTLDLTDFAFPAQFTSIEALVAQDGAALGASLPAVGTQSITAQSGPLSVLVFATPDPTNGSLFGAQLTASGSNSPAFAVTQGVGTAFAATQVSITTPGSYQVSLTDLDFPAQFATLGVAVTQGANKIGYVYGGGQLPPFAATAGNYTINVVAVPGGTDQAGLYAMALATAPAPPTVTLSTDETSVASGGTVHILWSSQNASSCAASSSPTGGGWSGSVAPDASGTATSGALTVSTTFTLTCTNAGGSTAATATVNISSASGKGGGGTMSSELLALLAGLVAKRVLSARRASNTEETHPS
ncbi:MAG TPA: hypothetical protein VMU67_00685 [Steroidobacteraceae bacterium]|nr:hypothetical protein [Steroidobacteraceae bacterium]